MIPDQLRREDLLFVLLPPKEKGLNTRGWNLAENGLKVNDRRLHTHLSLSGNYGFYGAPGSCVLPLDIDQAEAFHEAGGEDLVSGTFMYSAHQDRKKYRAVVLCEDIPAHWYGRKSQVFAHGAPKGESPVLELFYPAGPVQVWETEIRPGGTEIRKRRTEIKTAGQVVGPNSIHPNGNTYEIFDVKAPLKAVKWADILAVSERIRPGALEEQKPKNPKISGEYALPGRRLIRDRYNLSLWDHLPTDSYPSGEEVRGTSPFHDSTSKGGNVAINLQKGVYYCFRHQIGYDAAGLDAIARGIIECGQEYDGNTFKKHAEELERDFPEVRALEKELWKRQKQAEARSR